MHALHGGSAMAEDAGGARVLLVYPMCAQLHHLLVVEALDMDALKWFFFRKLYY